MLKRAYIRSISVALPESVVENDGLLSGVPDSQRAVLMRHTGVAQRRVAAPDETALDLGERACRALFARHPELPGLVDGLIFCTQSPDYVLPPNSCVLHGRLALKESVAAFDLPHACSAYPYAIGLAQAMIGSGSATHVLVVTADTYSKLIHPRDRSARLLFGDAAAATWLEAATGDRGVVDVAYGTAGRYFESFLVPAGGSRQPLTDEIRGREEQDGSGNIRSPGHIHMQGREILSFVSHRIPTQVRDILARNGLTLDAVDWFVFHQASSVVLESLTRLLQLPPAKVLQHFAHVGNTVSASIPLTLEPAVADGRIQPGQLVLLCGFGVGLSWGSVLLRW